MELISKQWEEKLNPNHKRKLEGKDGATENVLYCWFVNAIVKEVPLPGPFLMEEAESLTEKPW